jgi:hypothetical protein
MKTTIFVLFVMFLLCSLTFAQEQTSPQPAEPVDKIDLIKNSDFTITVKTDKGLASDSELADLAGIIVARLREKNSATVIGCDLFVAINPIVNETTKKLKRVLRVGVYVKSSISIPDYPIGKLPKSLSEKDQQNAIDQALDKVLGFQCPEPKQ